MFGGIFGDRNMFDRFLCGFGEDLGDVFWIIFGDVLDGF